jgi:vacuolar-type H+-ATPase subunit C/Vma6
MAVVDTAYIIGVIREWERGLLEADEYTRLIEAPDPAAAVRVLVDTPYGRYLREDSHVSSVFDALTSRLCALHAWLGDVLDDRRAWQFASSRYDALNLACALLARRAGDDAPGKLSELGSLPPAILESAFWHNLGWDQIPEFWEMVCRELLEGIEAHSPHELTGTIAQAEAAWRDQLAFTPLMGKFNALREVQQKAAQRSRPFSPSDDATAAERADDEALLELIREFRFEPVGYDPILAFWFAVELEVKQLRLLLAAHFNGMPVKVVQQLRRPLFRPL